MHRNSKVGVLAVGWPHNLPGNDATFEKGIRQAWTGAMLNKLRFKVTLLNKCRPRWDWSEQKFWIWDSFKGTNSWVFTQTLCLNIWELQGTHFPLESPNQQDCFAYRFCTFQILWRVCMHCLLPQQPVSCEQPPDNPFSTASSFCLDSERLICLQLQLWPLRLLSAYACDWGPPSRKAIWDHEQWGSLGLETKWRALGKTESI